MFRFKLTMTLSLVLGVAGMANAASPGRLGTSGALELLIPTDARGVAMGGSIMAEHQGIRSFFWNPAGAADITGNEIAVSHRKYLADIGLNHFAYARPAGSLGVISLSAKVLSSSDEPVYTIEQPDGTGETFASSYVIIGASFARTLTDRVALGINAHYIAEQIYRETAQGLAFDVGFTYHPTLENLTVGVLIKNLGPRMRFDGPDFTLPSGSGENETNGRSRSASFELPTFMQFGLAWDAWAHGDQRLKLVGAFQANNFSDDEWRLGSEWSMSDQLFLRGGYVASALAGYQYGFSAGAGLRVPLGETLTRIDYAWVEAGVFESNHLFTVSLAF